MIEEAKKDDRTPRTENEDGVGRTVWPDAHSLDEYEFDHVEATGLAFKEAE